MADEKFLLENFHLPQSIEITYTKFCQLNMLFLISEFTMK